MLTTAAAERVGAVCGSPVARARSLSGGCVGDVASAELEDGRRIVVKTGPPGAKLDLEGWMLRALAERSDLPVPAVLADAPDLLVMEHVEGSTGCSRAAEPEAASLLAELHGVTAERFGLERDTLIGGLHQPNAETNTWTEFFRVRRLEHMASECVQAGRAPDALLARARALGERLPELIDEPAAPALLHGDLWGGNIMTDGARVTGFIDPAIYYGHPEIELAFTTLFSTFTPAFYEQYAERRPIAGGFWEERRDLYNLYPLLVHVRLFGGSYLGQAERTLARFGV